MSHLNGIVLLRAAQALDPDVADLVLMGQASIDTAVEAMQAGACDYVVKPFRMQQRWPVPGGHVRRDGSGA